MTITPHYDLTPFLAAIREDVPWFDKDRLRTLITEALLPQIKAEAARQKFEIGELLETKLHGFRTPKPNCLAVDWFITTRAEHAAESRTDCRAIAHGNCYHDTKDQSICGQFLERVLFKWKTGQMATGFKTDDPSLSFPRPRDLPWE